MSNKKINRNFVYSVLDAQKPRDFFLKKSIMNWRCGCAQYILFRSIYFLIFLAQIFLFLVAISPFLTLTLDRLPFYVAFNAEMVCCVRKVNKKISFRLVVSICILMRQSCKYQKSARYRCNITLNWVYIYVEIQV